MRSIKVFLAVLLVSGVAIAQDGVRARAQRGQGSGPEALKTFLNLTDQQVTDIRAIQSTTRESIRPIAQQLAQKARALREELKKDPVNSSAVSALRSEIAGLQNQIKTAREGSRGKTRSVLNSTQLSQLAELEKALALIAAARQAVGLNLIDGPEGTGPGPALMRGIRARRIPAEGPLPRQPRKI